jgi:S1-C subfamily serine protease
MELAVDEVARVKQLTAGSAAEKAGFQVGDDIQMLAGQRLISTADVSWALHQAPESGSLDAVVVRKGQKVTLSLPLVAGWRNHSDISRRVGTWSMRAMALGGLVLEDLSDEERRARGLKDDQLALVAKHVGEYGQHAAAKKAGFKKGDVIVEIAGAAARTTEGELIGRLLNEYKPGDRVQTTVLRANERLSLTLPMQ